MNEYDDGKIWFRKKGGVVTVGLTEKAFEEIGGVQGINLPAEGDDFSQDDVVAEVEGDKATFEVICPLDGSVVEVNENLNEEMELLESDPLDEGWMFKLKVQKGDDDSESEESEE